VCSQYEERELRVQEERAQKRMEFDNQKMRLTNQLEFERSRDTMSESDWLSFLIVVCVVFGYCCDFSYPRFSACFLLLFLVVFLF